MPSQKERKKLFRADGEAAAQRTASGTGNNQGTMNMDVDEQSRPSTTETLINSSATEQPRPSTAKTPSTSSSDHLMGTSSDPQSHDVPRFASSQRAASKTKPTPSASLTSTPAKQTAPPKAPLGPSPSLAAKSSAPKSTFQKVTAPKPTMSNEQGGAFVRQFGPPKLSATSTQPPASQPDKLVDAPAPKPIGSQGFGNLFDNQGVKIPQTTSTNVAPNYARAAQEKRNLNQFMDDIPETYKGSKATGSYQSKQHMGKADARKTAENNARERAELEKFADSFWDGKPKGADHPRGKFHAEWNRPRHPALVVVKTSDPEKPFWVSSDYQVGYNVVYGLNSQFPDLHFTEKALKSQLPDLSAKRQKRDDGLKSDAAPIDPMTETFKIIAASVNSFENPDDPDGLNEVIFDGTILGANPELDAITDLFGKILMSGMSNTVARKVREFIYVKPGGNTKVGLKVYTLSLNDKNDHLYSGSSKLSALLKANISKKPVIAVIRNYYLIFPAVDRFWKGIMTEAVTYGTFPHYNSSGAPSWWPNKVKAINSSAEPSKATDPLKRETWMKDNTGKYHSHDKVVRFDTNKQFRDLLSATLYTDTVAKVESVQTLCNDATFHPATVTYVNPEGMVVLDVRFQLQNVDQSIPHFPEGSIMDIKPEYQATVEEEQIDNLLKDNSMEVDSWDAPADTDMSRTPPVAYTRPVFEATVRDHETRDGDCMLLFDIKNERRVKLDYGTNLLVSLDVTLNHTPVLRQLEAVHAAARDIKPGDRGHDLQHALMGRKVPFTQQHEIWWKSSSLTPDLKVLKDSYLDQALLNESQVNMVFEVFDTPSLLTLGVGPPGTGKSKTMASIAMCATMVDKHVIAGATTNFATKEMLKRFRVERKILQRLDKNGINDSKLVFFQTLPMIKMQLQTRQDLVEDRDDHFWSHFVQLKQRDLQNPSVSDTDRSEARLWLDMHNTIQSGGSIQGDDLTWYLELFQKQWRRVFNETKETLIVVTTANNGHLLRSKAIKWKPDLAIVDEAASGLEADSLILLTLGAERIVLVGDNDQLKPLVFTINQCEYYLQLGLSVFQRLVEGGHARFQLNVNYRMHQRIAMFPGMVTYTWLGCGDKTWEETVDFKLVSEWWNSPAARPIRLLRRNPWASSGLKTSSDCRRLLFNTTGSRSAPLPGRKSLRNFGNVNAMVEILDMLLAHRGADGISRVNGQSITIITGYRDQQDELKKQFGVRIVNWEELGSYMDTIDAMQGGENDIIFLELTTANEFHGSKIGFLKEWPRMNVALTRAKSVLWMFGNWEKWVEEIHMLAKENTTNKFALLMADLLELGDIVDIFRFSNKGEPDPRALRLPATRDEIERSPEMWSREIEHGNHNDIVWKNNDTARHAGRCSMPVRRETLLNLMASLAEKRSKYWAEDNAWKARERAKQAAKQPAAGSMDITTAAAAPKTVIDGLSVGPKKAAVSVSPPPPAPRQKRGDADVTMEAEDEGEDEYMVVWVSPPGGLRR